MSSIHSIIVNYNSGDWLSRCLTSVISNSDAGITVVDNCSTDDSLLLAQYKFAGKAESNSQARINWLLNKQNIGFAAANNQVLKDIDGDFVLLLNPDCEIDKDTLPLMLKAFIDNPNLGLASCAIYNEDGSLQKTCRRRFPTPWSAVVRMLQLNRLFPNNEKFKNFDYGDQQMDLSTQVEFVEAISGAFMMVRKDALDSVGLLDEGYFMHCEDLDWCKRFEKSDWDVGFVPQAGVIHAKGVSSKSRPIRVLWTLHKGMNRFFDKHYFANYSLLLSYLVKFGIWFSFILRSSHHLLRGILSDVMKLIIKNK